MTFQNNHGLVAALSLKNVECIPWFGSTAKVKATIGYIVKGTLPGNGPYSIFVHVLDPKTQKRVQYQMLFVGKVQHGSERKGVATLTFILPTGDYLLAWSRWDMRPYVVFGKMKVSCEKRDESKLSKPVVLPVSKPPLTPQPKPLTHSSKLKPTESIAPATRSHAPTIWIICAILLGLYIMSRR